MAIVDHHSIFATPLAAAIRLGALAGCLLSVVCVLAAPSAEAGTTNIVDLGTSSQYAVLSGASVGNTVSAVGAPHTTLRGGLAVEANTQPLGFPPGVVTGAVDIGNSAASQAHADATAAYNAIVSRGMGVPLAGALAGTTVGPGLYTVAGAVSNTTTVTLDAGGDPNAVFVFQVGGALAMAAGSQVVLANGAQASHVFWQVNGAGAVGANASFAGTMIALNAVAIGNGSIVNGRAFALNGALTLDLDQFYSSPPLLSIGGGASTATSDTTPTISGTTDVDAPALVTVRVNGQTLTALPSGGAWSVTSAMLANDVYPVVASVTDGASNTTLATQLLTVDTVLPIVTISGGPSVTTNDPTPTIGGSTDVASGAFVLVTVGAQTLTAFVQPGGAWNVTPAALGDGVFTVSASVLDLAGNSGLASQTLTVDTVAPAVTITGGASALTNHASPTIAGTAAVAAGTSVTVTLADETLTGLVQADGSWLVASGPLVDGPHRAIMEVSDAAGNASTLTQTLTVDTASPIVAIAGGASATTAVLEPTIRGTSDAAPGTIVTVAIADQTLTTLLQANGSWNATPTRIGEGVYAVSATVPDPAGNVGSAGQILTVSLPFTLSNAGATVHGPLVEQPLTPPLVTLTPAMPPATGENGLDELSQTRVTPNSVQKLSGSSFSIKTKVTAPDGVRLVVSARGAIRVAGLAHAITLTTQKRVLAGHPITLRIRLHGGRAVGRAIVKRLEAAIAAGKIVTARITLTLVDDAGHTRIARRVVQLT